MLAEYFELHFVKQKLHLPIITEMYTAEFQVKQADYFDSV
jgi:hypothetical protein